MTPEEARNDGIRRADQGADPEWREAARICVLATAWNHERFTADEVWELLAQHYSHLSTPEPSALGPVFLKVAAAGHIVKTGDLRLSKFSRRHRDLTVWRAA
jgi:hypothetical protein